ncbi:NUDIX hydrolase [Geomicrobium sp. JCM 19037]|uniref:NUDIX hydrolase n=1 Tax=Geomicrobium sp. JCM 19037 TaxID=1460634 RepID=UPI00187C4F89|nr:NUDIX hydrolase [Geomicrobium sp. JCM 19037]
MSRWHRHLGIYGICHDHNELLVIHKTKGPYKGMFDLPGGSINECETLRQALKREFLEETGQNILINHQIGTFDFLVDYRYKQTDVTHHIAIFVDVSIEHWTTPEIEAQLKGQAVTTNDSSGVEWIGLEEMTELNSSPLVRKAATYILDGNVPL